MEGITMNNGSQAEVLEALTQSWPRIVEECRSVLGSELHYQAVVYHCLRSIREIPSGQLGMNVKIWIPDAVSVLFRGGRKPIPDVVIFSPDIASDFRRRNYANTLRHMLLAAEMKVSERFQGRLQAGEIAKDILKLDALRLEARACEAAFVPAVIIVDTAPDKTERMGSWALKEAREVASSRGVCLFYLSPEDEFFDVPKEI